MQIRHLDRVVVHQPDRADPGAREIRSGRTAQAADADDQDARTLQPHLACVSLCVSLARSSTIYLDDAPSSPISGRISCRP